MTILIVRLVTIAPFLYQSMDFYTLDILELHGGAVAKHGRNVYSEVH